MVLGHILLWLRRLELAEFVSTCQASNWQVPGDHGVRTPSASRRLPTDAY